MVPVGGAAVPVLRGAEGEPAGDVVFRGLGRGILSFPCYELFTLWLACSDLFFNLL